MSTDLETTTVLGREDGGVARAAQLRQYHLSWPAVKQH